MNFQEFISKLSQLSLLPNIRFKRSVEIFWKLLKDYFCAEEGFVCESPKSCMRMAFKVGLMDDEETVKALEMIDLRLKSEHAYHKEMQNKSTGR